MKPPPAVHFVMSATYMLLGESEKNLRVSEELVKVLFNLLVHLFNYLSVADISTFAVLNFSDNALFKFIVNYLQKIFDYAHVRISTKFNVLSRTGDP